MVMVSAQSYIMHLHRYKLFLFLKTLYQCQLPTLSYVQIRSPTIFGLSNSRLAALLDDGVSLLFY